MKEKNLFEKYYFYGLINIGLVVARDSLHYGEAPKTVFWTILYYLGYVFVTLVLFAIGTKAAEIAIGSNACCAMQDKCKNDSAAEWIEMIFGLLAVAILFLIGCLIMKIGA